MTTSIAIIRKEPLNGFSFELLNTNLSIPVNNIPVKQLSVVYTEQLSDSYFESLENYATHQW
jgi:hypothetical protein